MEKIYSKVSQEVTHIIQRFANIQSPRHNLIDDREFIQVSAHKLQPQKFRAHKHLWKICDKKRLTQESWIIIKGSVLFTAYDLDDTIISTHTLGPGDCVINLYGGHNYETLEPDTIVYEFKTGPYEGIEQDKEFIDD